METLAVLSAVPAGSLGAMAAGIAVVTGVAWLAGLAASIAAAARQMAGRRMAMSPLGAFIAQQIRAAREAREERLHLSPTPSF